MQCCQQHCVGASQARRTTVSQPTSRRNSRDPATGKPNPPGKLVNPLTGTDESSSLHHLLQYHGSKASPFRKEHLGGLTLWLLLVIAFEMFDTCSVCGLNLVQKVTTI